MASKAGHRLTEIEQLARQSSHLLTAGTANEESIATVQLGGSVFTAAVLDGLRGKADSANAYPRDGVVTLRELQGYVRKRVDQERRAAGWRKTITPQLRDLATSDGEFFFLTSEQKIARLKGAGEKPNGDFAYGRPLSTGPDHVRSKGGKTKIESFSVHFGSDSASLNGDTALLLKEVVNACSEGAIGLTGHTGLDGTAAYNLAISSRRLNVVRRELISLGMPESSFDNSVLAMGEDEQKAPPFTPSGDALNHRVEIVCVN